MLFIYFLSGKGRCDDVFVMSRPSIVALVPAWTVPPLCVCLHPHSVHLCCLRWVLGSGSPPAGSAWDCKMLLGQTDLLALA
jgi:hypothetical protein